MPVLLYHGDNPLEIEDAARAMRRRFNDVDTILYDGTVALPDLTQTCATAGLFAPERLVIVTGLEERLKGTRKPDEAEAVRRVLDAVAPTTTLLLLSPSSDGKCTMADLVRKAGGSVRVFMTPKRGELPRWIASRGTAHRVTVRRDAADLLAELVGATPMQLDAELEKLATYVGDGGTVTTAAVEALVGSVPQESIFALVDAVAVGDTARALRLIRERLDGSSSSEIELALSLIRLLARQMRMLLRIRLGTEAGRSRGELIAELKLNRYFADRYFRQAGRLPVARLRQAFELLASFEHRLKTGRVEAGSGLDTLVARLCA